MDKQIWMGKLLIITLIVPFLIYLKTLLPTVGFWDTGEFQTIAYTFDVGHPTGYPTYVILGKIFTITFPFGSIAWRMNILSAILVSIGIYIFSLLIKKLSKNTFLAIVFPILLSVNPYLWAIATRADPHTLHFFFTSLFLFLSYEVIEKKSFKYFIYLSGITGLSLGNHMLSIFFIPSLFLIGLYLIKNNHNKKTYKQIILAIFSFILGVSIYLFIPIVSYFKTPFTIDFSPTTFQGFKRLVMGEDFQGIMRTWIKQTPFETFKYYFSLIQKSFPFYSWVFAVFGLILTLIKRRLFDFAILLIFILTVLFGLTYQNAAIERYFIPSFMIAIYWFSRFISFVLNKSKHIIFSSLITVYLLFSLINILTTNYKDLDQSKNYYAYNWANETINSLDENSVIFSWWSYSTPLWYLQKVEGVRKDILIINASKGEWEYLSKNFIGKRTVYFIEEVDSKNLNLKKQGNVYRIVSNNQR